MIFADALHMDILIAKSYGGVQECELVESESHCKKSAQPVMVHKRYDHYDIIVYNYTVINVASEVRSSADTQDQQLQDVDNVCSTLFQDGKCNRDKLRTTNSTDYVLFRRRDMSINISVNMTRNSIRMNWITA